ncbi:hypothetical protein TNCV_1704641 [Trichonephila clavipes]|nr:hypothetical protein TNCV_1704641 [Trichonephila clavipes]
MPAMVGYLNHWATAACRVCQELDYRIIVCRVTKVSQIEHLIILKRGVESTREITGRRLITLSFLHNGRASFKGVLIPVQKINNSTIINSFRLPTTFCSLNRCSLLNHNSSNLKPPS